MVEEGMSQLESIMSIPVRTSATADIDRHLIPILTQIMKHCEYLIAPTPQKYQHPQHKYLLDWLLNPHHTVDEFNYVIGPLSNYVFKLKEQEVYGQTEGGVHRQLSSSYHKYLFQVAIEFLTVKCRILKGSWEHAAWLMVRLFKKITNKSRTSYSMSDSQTSWIICVISDANICSNAILRLELIRIFLRMNIYITNHNQSKILDSVMLATSSLDIKHLDGFHSGEFSMIEFKNLLEIFQLLIGDVIFVYSHNLTIKLRKAKNLRLSSIINDVAYRCSMNPSLYNEPYEFYSLTHLIKTITEYVCLKLKESEEEGRNFNSDSRLEKVQSVSAFSWILIYHFKECLVLPQLISITASFIMEVMEFVCLTSRGLAGGECRFGIFTSQPYLQDIRKVNLMLKDLCDEQGYEDMIDSPLGQEILGKYSKRLKSLRNRLMDISIFSHIHDLIYYDQLLETGTARLPHIFDMRW